MIFVLIDLILYKSLYYYTIYPFTFHDICHLWFWCFILNFKNYPVSSILVSLNLANEGWEQVENQWISGAPHQLVSSSWLHHLDVRYSDTQILQVPMLEVFFLKTHLLGLEMKDGEWWICWWEVIIAVTPPHLHAGEFVKHEFSPYLQGGWQWNLIFFFFFVA